MADDNIDIIITKLLIHKQTLAIAESCSGGGLSYNIVKRPDVSKVFLGSVVAYANAIKEKILLIPQSIINEKGAVSEEVAIMMADNCKKIFASDWALSITGISGPNGGSKIKPVGMVWIGISGPNISKAESYIFSNVSREEHQKLAINQALLILKDHLL